MWLLYFCVSVYEFINKIEEDCWDIVDGDWGREEDEIVDGDWKFVESVNYGVCCWGCDVNVLCWVEWDVDSGSIGVDYVDEYVVVSFGGEVVCEVGIRLVFGNDGYDKDDRDCEKVVVEYSWLEG